MDKLILLFCSLISCAIVVSIMFQFLNDRYIRSYAKSIYIYMQVLNVTIVMIANMFMNPILNLIVNVLCVALISYFFYEEHGSKKIIRVLESEALLIIIGVSEALGVYLIDMLLNILGIMPMSTEIRQSIEIAFSKIVVLFLYYVIFTRIWKKSVTRSKAQYILYFVMFVYSIINVLTASAISNEENLLIIVALIGFTIFANMYFLYFIKFSDERNFYKLRFDMMKQQEKLQYENNELQREKYTEAMSTLHDVDKHIKMIESLYQEDLKNEAIDYTRKINYILRSLVPIKYIDNPVLNCLLSDKAHMAEKLEIDFSIEIFTVDINFMEPVSITTLFGNLIDNAITASKQCHKRKYIGFYMKEYNDIISIRIENSVSEAVSIRDGMLSEQKRGQRGIGLPNISRCVDNYEGNIIYKNSGNLLVCDIILNRVVLEIKKI